MYDVCLLKVPLKVWSTNEGLDKDLVEHHFPVLVDRVLFELVGDITDSSGSFRGTRLSVWGRGTSGPGAHAN